MTLSERRPPLNRPRLPRLWLVTDTIRLPDPIPAIARLPRGSGVLLRHHGAADRPRLAAKVAHLCRVHGLILLVANDWRLADHVGAQGVHLAEGVARHGLLAGLRLWRRRKTRLVSMAAHGQRAARRAQDLGADMIVLSQAFASRSHPGQKPWGPVRFALLARRIGIPVIALGGMNATHWRRLPKTCAWGWAALDGLTA